MKDLAEILEEELSEAVEVKNPKSLHRYISLLTGNYVEQNIHDRQYNELSGSIKVMLTTIHEGFRRMDERFAAQDQRFEDVNKRFDDVNKRFDRQHKLISLGFAAIALIIASFNLTVLLS